MDAAASLKHWLASTKTAKPPSMGNVLGAMPHGRAAWGVGRAKDKGNTNAVNKVGRHIARQKTRSTSLPVPMICKRSAHMLEQTSAKELREKCKRGAREVQ